MDEYAEEETVSEGSIDYDLRSDESDPPSLEEVEVQPDNSESSLVYEVDASRYCEYEQYVVTGTWTSPMARSRTCYEPRAGTSQFCYAHKCRSCDNRAASKSRYCMGCVCPVVGCNINAFACGNRCSCCDMYHRPTDRDRLNWRTCEGCVCAVCGIGPVVERHGTWGDVLLCAGHNICVVVKCGHACDIDNPRYCPKHKHEICKQLRTMELCLVRLQQPRDIRRLFCRWLQWARENQQICSICKGFCIPNENELPIMCKKCTNVKRRGMLEIGAEVFTRFIINETTYIIPRGKE